MSKLPDLDEQCGEHFTYRDFIECGETWRLSAIENAPKQPETYAALERLATEVLDKVVSRFGRLELTYGFASPELTKQIKKNIAPNKDQHAANELNSKGNPICYRGGAACDFRVDGVDSWDLAQWVAANTKFDRLYFYGSDRPIHVSAGPQNKRSVTLMRCSIHRRHPWKTLDVERFLLMPYPAGRD